MGKITPIVVFPNVGYDSGETAKNKINEAMKTVEVDSSLSGDGTAGNPLKVGSSHYSTQESDLAIVTNDIAINVNSKNIFNALNTVIATSNTTITLSNITIARIITFDIEIQNSSTLTLNNPGGYTIESEEGGGTLDLGDGIYTISMKITPTDSIIRIVRSNPFS